MSEQAQKFWISMEKGFIARPQEENKYSWNSEVETTWISLIGWPLRTSNIYLGRNLVFLIFVTNFEEKCRSEENPFHK